MEEHESAQDCLDNLAAYIRLLEAENERFAEQIAESLAENKQLRKDVKLEQDLRKNYHNEETAMLREVLKYIQENSSCGVARQWAKKAEGKE